jgi:hypothetical protein
MTQRCLAGQGNVKMLRQAACVTNILSYTDPRLTALGFKSELLGENTVDCIPVKTILCIVQVRKPVSCVQ